MFIYISDLSRNFIFKRKIMSEKKGDQNIFKVLFVTRGEGCASLPGAQKLQWFKRVHKRNDDKGILIKSSDTVISTEKMEDFVHIALENVEQVFSDSSETNTSTAQSFFPHISPDVIRFQDKKKFHLKLKNAVYSDVVAAIVSPNQLTMLTGIVDTAYFAIHAVEYRVTNNELQSLKSDIVSHGTVSDYNTISDLAKCNIDEDIKHYKRMVIGTYSNWLDLIRDDVKLHKLRILQSHDTSTGFMNFYDRTTWQLVDMKFLPNFFGNIINRSETVAKWSITQTMTVVEQLAAGVRSFDLRVFTQKNKEIFMHHGAIIIKVNFFDILQTLLTFLSEHPNEFLYILLKISGDGNMDDVWEKFVDMTHDRLILPNCRDAHSLTVGEVRGKMLAWSAESKFTGTNNDVISYYKTFDQPGCKGDMNKITKTWNEFEETYMPCFPLKKDRETLFVFQLHTQVDIQQIKDQNGAGAIQAGSRRFNSKAMNWLQNIDNDRTLNIIEMDYVKSSFIKPFIWNLNKENLKENAKEIFDNIS
jgi:hypothetical protein